MEATRGVRIVEYSGDSRRQGWATVPSVYYYDLYVNGNHVAELKGMPVALKELALGFLLANNYIDDHHIVERIDVSAERIDVYADSEFDFRLKYWQERGIRPIDDVKLQKLGSQYSVARSKIAEKVSLGFRRAPLFTDIGATSFAFITDDNGYFFIAEDVYPESAIYKAVGKAALVNFDMRRSILFTSEILLPEYVVYAAVLGVPIVGSFRGVPSLSIDLASAVTGQTLFQSDGEHVRVYTAPGRIL